MSRQADPEEHHAQIDNDDRIALLGSNGNGKSTFAKFISGRLEAQGGEIRWRRT